MLVLTRRIGEKIIIRDDIILTVLSIRGLQVKFGIDAPKDIKIWREELLTREAYFNSNKEIGNG